MSVDSGRFIIYALHHPASEHVYIGKSSTGMTRPREHFQAVTLRRDARLPKAKWITSMRERGLEPEIAVLEECEIEAELNEAEQFHIANFKSLGISLLNCTEGGDGGAEISRRYWSNPESRERQRAERQGKTWSAEVRAKMSAAAKGRKKTPEQRANMAAAAKERWKVPGYKEKQIEAQRIANGTPERRAQAAEYAKLASHDTHRSAEYRVKQSERAKAAYASDEARAKKSETTKRAAQDPAYREKMSEARKLAWQNPEYREKVIEAKRRKRERQGEDPE